jgi:hypothetical protein
MEITMFREEMREHKQGKITYLQVLEEPVLNSSKMHTKVKVSNSKENQVLKITCSLTCSKMLQIVNNSRTLNLSKAIIHSMLLEHKTISL